MLLTMDKMMTMLPTFNGKAKELDPFIRICDLIFSKIPTDKSDTVSEGILIQVVLAKLVEEAQFIYKNGSSYETWDSLKKELTKQCKNKIRTSDIERELSEIIHKPNESVKEFSLKLKEIWYLFGETLAEITDENVEKYCRTEFEKKLIEEFKDKLREPLRHWIKPKTFTNFKDAIDFALEEEPKAYKSVVQILDSNAYTGCFLCGLKGHNMSNCRNSNNRTNIRCNFCNKMGHIQSQCRNRQKQMIYRIIREDSNPDHLNYFHQ